MKNTILAFIALLAGNAFVTGLNLPWWAAGGYWLSLVVMEAS